MGVGDFLIKAGTSVLGGAGKRMQYESSPEAKLARETQERNLRTDAIAASQEQRQKAQEERNAATGKLKTIMDVLGAKPEIRKQIIASPETESIEKALGLPSGTFSSINKLGNDNTDLLLSYIGTRIKEPQKLLDSMEEVLGGKTLNEQLLALDPILKRLEFIKDEEALSKLTTSRTPIEPPPDSPQLTHKVRDGETLFSIARKYYGETGSEQWKMVNKIYEANNLSELGQGKNTIYRGQELIIPDAPMPISGEEADIGVDTGIEPEAPVEPTASEKIRIKRDKYNQEKERLDNQKKELLARRKGLLTLRKSPQRKRELELIKEALEFNQEEQKILLTGRDLLQKREKVVIENQAARLEAANNASVLKQKRMLLNLYAGGWENGLQVVNRDGTPVTETVTLPPTKEHPNGEVVERPVFADKVARRSVKTGEVLRDANDNILYMDLEEALIKLDDEAKAWLGTTKSNIGRFKGDRGSAYDFHEYIDRTVSERIGEEE